MAMTTDGTPDREALSRYGAALAEDLRGVARIEVRPGGAHEPDELTDEDDEPWAVIDDAEQIRIVVGRLASIDLSPRKVIPALSGSRLVMHDRDGDWLYGVDVLTDRWVRNDSWPYDGLLPTPLLTGVLDSMGRHIESQGRDAALDAAPAVPQAPSPIVDAVSALWPQRWPGVTPIGHHLRGGDRWVRFHTLPGSKRYADDEREYAEILRRHQVVLRELRRDSPTDSDSVVVVTCCYCGGPAPRPRPAPVARTTPQAAHWQSILVDEGTADGDPPIWAQLFVDRLTLDDPRLARLLRLVADDRTGDVIICDPDLQWLYSPYDGGADVIARTTAHRDTLRAAHEDWLSQHPQGL